MTRRVLAWLLAWVAAAALSVAVGVLVVDRLEESSRDRGPIGDNELIRQAQLAEPTASPDPEAEVVRRDVQDEAGTFVVECRGVVATGVDAVPDAAAGWRTVSFERGPDDDVEAVFAQESVEDGRSVEIEVFCNRGEPTVAEIERNVLPASD